METILVTGAAGYLGSHTCVELMAEGYDVVGLDDFSNSQPGVLDRIATLAGRPIRFYRADVCDAGALQRLFLREAIDGVVHFAGLKAVGDSVREPLGYYRTNVEGSRALAAAMDVAGVGRIVFSSSATVYGDPDTVPIAEDAPMRPTNPYGRSKWMVEQMLRDTAAARPHWSVMLLRYFNPTGAHPSGLLGEDPSGTPNNLMPYLTQVAVGRRPSLQIFGRDYPTPDGTGVRDYVHVMDLARGHVAALRAAATRQGCTAVNLGTGQGSSVLELVDAFRTASAQPIPVVYTERRPGDVASTYADVALAHTLLDWHAERSLADMCADAWHWQSCNPEGYAGAAPMGEAAFVSDPPTPALARAA